MSDLRESGSLEQGADIIALIYRDEYYANKDKELKDNKFNKDNKDNTQPNDEAGKTDLNIAKHRNGETGWIRLNWDAQYAEFSDENWHRPNSKAKHEEKVKPAGKSTKEKYTGASL